MRDPRDPAKQQAAVKLTTGMGDRALLWQVACEFVSASRKLAPFGFTQAEAWRELERLRQLRTMILPSENVFTRAERLTATHNLSFWDSLLVAACIDGGVTRLYTEDFDASLSKTTGIEIINPFS